MPFISAKIEQNTSLVGFGKVVLTLDGSAAFDQANDNFLIESVKGLIEIEVNDLSPGGLSSTF